MTLFTRKLLDLLAISDTPERTEDVLKTEFTGNCQLGSTEGRAAELAPQLSVRLGHLGNQRMHSQYREGAGHTVRKELEEPQSQTVHDTGRSRGLRGGTWSENTPVHS